MKMCAESNVDISNNKEQIILISVVMPVFNSAEFLKESVESILNQTFKDFELICVYDKSKDDSLSILEAYAQNDSRVKIIVNEEKKGLPYALNLGLKAAKGKYIARMDADDIALPKRFEIQYKFLEKHNDIGGCGTFIKKIGNTRRRVFLPIKSDDIKVRLMFNCCIMHPTAMFRASLIQKYNLFYNEDYKVCEDFEFWIRFLSVAEFVNIPRVLLLYRVNNESISENQKILIEELNYKLIQQQFCDNLHIDSKMVSKIFDKNTKGKELYEVYKNILLKAKETEKVDYSKFKKCIRHFLYKKCHKMFKNDKKLSSLFETIRYNRLAFFFVLFNIVKTRSI